MKSCQLLSVTALLFTFSFTWISPADKWIIEKKSSYTLYYTNLDADKKSSYCTLLDKGITAVKSFSGDKFSRNFDVYIHPNRASLDAQWQKDWGMPDFKSECWMVASGIATRLDMIAPASWDKEACEHVYADSTKTRQLIAHELFHVYHGQRNASPDFSEVKNTDWFVEGFATYASGQCDEKRMNQVSKSIEDNTAPEALDDFWKGQNKYGWSGSMVMFIDRKYGRKKLMELLPLTSGEQVLNSLKITEKELVEGWKEFIKSK